MLLFLRIKQLLIKREPKQKNSDENKVLVVFINNGIGDFVIFIGILEGIRKRYGNSEITLLGSKLLETLVQKCPYIDKFIPFEISAFFRYPFYQKSLLEKLLVTYYETAIYPSFSRHLIGDIIMKACFAGEKIGYDGNSAEISRHDKERNNKNYSRLVKPPLRATSELDHYYHFAEELGIGKEYLRTPWVWIDDNDRSNALFLLKANGINDNDRFAVICPGAGSKKRFWHREGFANICDHLHARGYVSVITEGKNEGFLADSIIKLTSAHVINLIGKTDLRYLAAIYEKASLYIGNETGPNTDCHGCRHTYCLYYRRRSFWSLLSLWRRKKTYTRVP